MKPPGYRPKAPRVPILADEVLLLRDIAEAVEEVAQATALDPPAYGSPLAFKLLAIKLRRLADRASARPVRD